MILLQHNSAKVLRYATAQIPAVAAGGQSGVTSAPTPDDPKTRKLLGVFSTMQTKNLQIQILKAGSVKMTFDSAAFAAAGGFLDVDWDYAAALPFQFNVISLGNNPVEAVNTDEIVFRYETDPDV
jgi:hypothetical protein